MLDSRPLAEAVAAVTAAKRLVALTGAGISAESGIPTFREAQTGLWAQFSPQDLATPAAFARNPERVWAWYRWRRTLIARGGVNPGHDALAALEQHRALTVATQNVDGLHAAAGSSDIAELHGNIWHERCTRCDAEYERPVESADDTTDEAAPLPQCATCGAITRPAVVWFGEMLPAAALNSAQSAIERADCVLVVGTSSQVYPAAALVEQAVASAACVIEVNPEPTAMSAAVDIRLPERASRALPALAAALDGPATRG